jgi:hypothetical protein
MQELRLTSLINNLINYILTIQQYKQRFEFITKSVDLFKQMN